jgi:hypothetical protein
MLLDKVSSCETRYLSFPILLVLGIVAMLLGGYTLMGLGGEGVGAMAIATGLVFIIAYFVTRKHVVSIASDGGARIGFETKGMKREAVVSLINWIEKAKHERMLSLSQSATPVYA